MFANLTVAENLHVPDISRSLLNRVGRSAETGKTGLSDEAVYEQFPRLDERRGQKAGTLSGGEQQMLAIARALKQDTDLLMLDEPSEGLAPQIVEDVVEALRAASADTTMVLVEQNFRLAMDLADRFYLVDHGVVVEEGETAGVTSEDERIRRYLTA